MCSIRIPKEYATTTNAHLHGLQIIIFGYKINKSKDVGDVK